ncbi:MAG TPA: hypothetical protein VGC39_05605 [Candidatus Methylacidiphilales bacterium]
MHLVDWIITFLPIIFVLGLSLYARQYVKSVADFMSGGRSAGRYLLAIAGNEMQSGAAVFVASFEMISHSGFVLNWWWWFSTPVILLVNISGFVVYRYRETRAMTLAQFFEIRYSKPFRIFTGILGFFAGILNFGIMPAIGSRCLVYLLGLPASFPLLSLTVPTYLILMALFLAITLFVTLSGGVVTVMLTNCFEGVLSQIFFLIIIFTLLATFSWAQIMTVVENQPPGHSMLNPFDAYDVQDFNIWYVLMGLVVNIYGTMAWQNAGAFNSAGFSPHEGRMGGILGRWRDMGRGSIIILLVVCAVTFLHHPAFAAQAAQAQSAVHQIPDPHTQGQMVTPVALSYLLPAGVKGVLCAVLLMGIFGGDSTQLHSWGSIFVQDILVPLRNKPFGARQHLRMLRLSIIGVATFAFIFGSLFRPADYILMWWAVTQAIYTGGAGSAIIGGLYWKKGTTTGAWAALITGSVLSVGGIIAKQVYDRQFPLNGVQISFFATLIAIAIYVIVSLLTNREDFNMDRMLHRGAYAKIKPVVGEPVISPHGNVWLGKLIGLDENFTLTDKWIACSLFGWTLIWFLVFIIGTIWNQIDPWPTSVWASFWHVVAIGLPIFFAVVTGVWFTWGGLRDMKDLFRRLGGERVNHLDDGTVINHQNLDELAVSIKEKL